MGDMLCATPLLRSLRQFYPKAHLILVTKSSTRFDEVFKNDTSFADEVRYYESGIERFVNLLKELREKNIDIAVVPSTVTFSVTNHLLAYWSGAKFRAGVASINDRDNPAGFLLNIKSHFMWDTKKVHQVERNLDVIRQLGIVPAERKIRIFSDESSLRRAKNFIEKSYKDLSKPLVAFHPGAAKTANIWPIENFFKLACLIYDRYNVNFFISEGPHDTPYTLKLENRLREKYPEIGISRHKDFTILSLCNLFITNDTGVMHIASGFNIPVIALFAQTNAYEWGPLSSNQVAIQSPNSEMSSIKPEKVFEICKGILG
jgi:heptosyltransferase-2